MDFQLKPANLLACLILAFLLTSCELTPPGPICTSVYTVTKTADTDDGACSAGDCSLREAVNNANACPGTQTINLPAGGYALTIDGDDEDLGATGDLDVTDDLVIIGTGIPSVHGGIERAFQIHNGVTADFQGIWLTDGDAIIGGGLLNEGNLTLTSFTCSYNTVSIPPGGMGDARGGCIFNTSSLIIQGAQFLANTAAYGGAIYNLDNSTAVLEDINFTGNQADSSGGALWIGVDADITMNGGTFASNQSGLEGGAVWNHGSLTGEDLVFENNEAGDRGGAIYGWTNTYTQFTNSWFTDNSAPVGGGIYNNNGMMHLYDSGVTNNTATGPVGGGIYNNGPVPTGGLLLKNVTISNNNALGGAGGGGVYNTGNFDFQFVTLSGNNPQGLRIDTGSEIKIRSSILAGNTGGDCAGIPPDSLDYNLDSDGSCSLSGTHDLSATDPLLDPLGFYGSLAPSHPLGSGSPAIDTGDPDRCISHDQNLTSRPQGSGCDRGAFENIPPGGSISGWTYIDANRNDIRDPDDGYMTGVFVDIHAGVCPPSGALVETVESGPGGYYETLDLPPGDYCLETMPEGQTLYPDEIEIPLSSGENREDVNFRYLLSPLGDSSISGLVWHDLCAIPYGPSSTIPPGCISLPSGGVGADGIYDPAEPGIPDVRLELFYGTCPPPDAPVAAVVFTDSSGEYSIPGLTPGTWCVKVNALDAPNDAILIPGNWTYPVRDDEPAYFEVVLGSSDDASEINFGWDYQFLPEPAPTPTPSYTLGKLNKNAFCRLGPGTVYDTATAFETGTEFEILARSESHLPLWLYIEELILEMRCWISSSTADYVVDPELIPTRIAPPTPTPRPTPTPLVCRTDLNKQDCQEAGGVWYVGSASSYCVCPKN